MKRLVVVLFAAAVAVPAGCGTSACPEGEHKVQDAPIYVKSGDVMVPIARSHCEE